MSSIAGSDGGASAMAMAASQTLASSNTNRMRMSSSSVSAIQNYDPNQTITQNLARQSITSDISSQDNITTPSTEASSSVSASASNESLDVQDIWNDFMSEPECASGQYCKAPPGTSVLNREGKASHHCFNCRKPFHCRLWCAIQFSEMKAKHGFIIHTSLLSPDGQARVGSTDPYNSDKEICYTCISRLKGPAINITQCLPAEANAGINTIALLEGAADEEGDSSGLQKSASVAPDGKPSIWNCSWEHVIVTAGESNIVAGKSTDPSNLTKLKGFHVAGQTIMATSIKIDDLKKWGSKLGIAGIRKLKKKFVADEIVYYRPSSYGASEYKWPPRGHGPWHQ